MDLLVSFPREMNLFSHPFLLLTPLFVLIIVLIKTKPLSSTKRQNIPPGPYPWPIIGNLLHLGKKPHIALNQLAQVHGPLISLKLGTRLMVVGNSPAAATEILKTHDRLLSARWVPRAAPDDMSPYTLVWSDECTDHWKSLRALCCSELFSARAIESQSFIREEKVGAMVSFLKSKEGKVVRISEVVFATIFNMLGTICFSKDLIDLKDERKEKVDNGLKGLISTMMELGATPNISDFYPIFNGLDPQGIRKKTTELMRAVFGVWGKVIKERRESQKDLDSSCKQDFLDATLACGYSDLQINYLILELISAGTDSTSSTIEWALADLLKNKEAMSKLREELKRATSTTSSIKESEISQLPYLQACVKETLRLHPPVPFLIPHRAIEKCEVMNYTIPKDSQVIVNIWAVNRDPMSWEDPSSFKPERFLDSDLDFKGHNFEFLPFGAGRKMCPALPQAAKQVTIILAALVNCFDWLLPNNEDPSELDMNEKFSIVLQKEQPLFVVPIPKW